MQRLINAGKKNKTMVFLQGANTDFKILQAILVKQYAVHLYTFNNFLHLQL